MKLHQILVGCTPHGRHIEQHDVYIGIAATTLDLVPQLVAFWPEAKGKIHLDAYRSVTRVDDFEIEIIERNDSDNYANDNASELKLFFINLGGYKPAEFTEYHYQMLVVGRSKTDAINAAKKTAFYKHYDFAGAKSHIDDKYGVDVDDLYQIEDLLCASDKEKYAIRISPCNSDVPHDELHIGYTKLNTKNIT